jgi:cytosine/adenosine deaminase-related metal-dependent hydrolase
MSYRRLKADYLFDGFIMRQNEVLICESDGTIEGIVDVEMAGGDLEYYKGILSPGFINCHCHLELSHLKGKIPEKQGLVNFVSSVVGMRNQNKELVQEAMLAAESDMLKKGIVGVGDICNTSDTRDLKSAGVLDYYNFIEVFGWAPEAAFARYEAAKKLAQLFLESNDEVNQISLNPHAPYSVSDELWKLIQPDFHGKTITIHNQESAAENEFFKFSTGDLSRMYSLMNINSSHFKATGSNSLPYYLSKLKNASNILLVHNTYMEVADLKIALEFTNNIFFCFCPNANIFIEDRLPDLTMFQKYDTQIVLGTDSLASNHQLSILEEMKTLKKSYPLTPTSSLLLYATSNGAKALSFQKSLGDFSKGKKPGVILIENIEGGEIMEASTSRRIL